MAKREIVEYLKKVDYNDCLKDEGFHKGHIDVFKLQAKLGSDESFKLLCIEEGILIHDLFDMGHSLDEGSLEREMEGIIHEICQNINSQKAQRKRLNR